jgi:hypothetical protein
LIQTNRVNTGVGQRAAAGNVHEATHPDAGKVTIKLTPDQEDIVAKYKNKHNLQ